MYKKPQEYVILPQSTPVSASSLSVLETPQVKSRLWTNRIILCLCIDGDLLLIKSRNSKYLKSIKVANISVSLISVRHYGGEWILIGPQALRSMGTSRSGELD